MKSKFGWGVFVGAVLGGTAAYFFSPQNGKANREMAKDTLEKLKKLMKEKNVPEMTKDIFGKATEEGQRLYSKARSELNIKLDEIKAQAGDIDYTRYKEVVTDVVSRLKEEKDASKDRLSRLQDYLLNRWDIIHSLAKEDMQRMSKVEEEKVSKKS
jgi:gas vesicle protein